MGVSYEDLLRLIYPESLRGEVADYEEPKCFKGLFHYINAPMSDIEEKEPTANE
jgi:hypothetical protein